MFKKIFGTKKQEAPPPPPQVQPTGSTTIETITVLETRINNLDKKRELTLLQANKLKKQAVAYNKAGKRQDALLALKRAKRLEQQADSYIGMIHSLENTKFNLESGSTSAEMLDALRGARDEMKRHTVDVDEADDVMLDLQEAQDRIDEVNGALAGNALDFDTDVMAEFDQLGEDDLIGEEMAAPAEPTAGRRVTPAAAPAAPAAQQEVKEEEDEFAELARIAVPSTAPMPRAPEGKVAEEAEHEADEFSELAGLMRQ